jgi:NAD(P)-dependent dehydrogenase (short-subunit alcohol dehydrogenase family)
VKVKLKKLDEQVLVMTGASSGIGLATARAAARRGARLVLASRNEEALRQIADEINASGGEAVYVVADVGEAEDVRRVGEEAVRRFGRIDTWVNNAGVSIYGRIMEVSDEDHRRLFETNFWGVVNGSRVAIEHLRGRGGALINVGSTVSDRAIPIQGMYSASKHAVKGFTDALRMELEAEGAPVSVTLVKPGSIDTPFTEHAKNYMEMEPTLPPPVYAPEVVAEVILHCAEHPQRDAFAGGGGKALSASGTYAPRLTDKLMEATAIPGQKSDRPTPPGRQDALYGHTFGGTERGSYAGHVAESSLYSKASLHPVVTGALLFGAGLALSYVLRPNLRRNGGRGEEWMVDAGR